MAPFLGFINMTGGEKSIVKKKRPSDMGKPGFQFQTPPPPDPGLRVASVNNFSKLQYFICKQT